MKDRNIIEQTLNQYMTDFTNSIAPQKEMIVASVPMEVLRRREEQMELEVSFIPSPLAL